VHCGASIAPCYKIDPRSAAPVFEDFQFFW
jgi:hypothetical protein